jgi:hypothetical protein
MVPARGTAHVQLPETELAGSDGRAVCVGRLWEDPSTDVCTFNNRIGRPSWPSMVTIITTVAVP